MSEGTKYVIGQMFVFATIIFGCVAGVLSINADKSPIITAALVIYGVWAVLSGVVWAMSRSG